MLKTLFNFTLVASALASPWAQAKGDFIPGSYAIDPAHSSVGFEVPHLVIATVEGKFTDFTGTIELGENLTDSKVEVVINTTSIDTGVGKRDDHLRSADFFNVQKIPQMTFKSKAIRGRADNLQIIGDLTIKGIKKKVTLDGRYLGSVVDGYGNQKAVFHTSTKINRKDFGLTWNNMVEAGPVVGDEVKIELKIQAARAQRQAGN